MPPNQTPRQPTRKFATQVGNWSLFQQNANQHSRKWEDLVKKSATKEQLDTTITTIWDDLEEINKACFPPFSPKSKYTPWWSTKLYNLRTQVYALKRRAKRCKNQALKETCSARYKEHKNRYKAEILKAKQDSWKEFCTENARSSPWKVYKMGKVDFARQPAPSSLTLLNGTVTTSAKETANTLLQKFLPDDPTAQDSVQHKNIRVQKSGSELPVSQTAPNFKNHEVDEVIAKLHDGTIVKRLHKILPTFWLTLFNTCFKLGCFPKVWKEANVIPIPKMNKKKLHTVQGYRGISLLSQCRRGLIHNQIMN
jgi:hypothetical protein